MVLPDKYQDEMKLHQLQMEEKDKKISELSKTLSEVSKKNTWMKEELDRVVLEKNKNQENISSGLRTDLEIAFREKKELRESLQIHCLTLERDLKQAQDEIANKTAAAKTKEELISDQKAVILGLQSQVEDSGKSGYRAVEEQLSKRAETVNRLSDENRDLTEKLSSVSEKYDSARIELDMVRSENNQMKLEVSSQLNDIMLKNEEEIQNLVASFEKTIHEKDAEVSAMNRLVYEKEQANDVLLSKLQEIEAIDGPAEVSKENKLESELNERLQESKTTIESLQDEIKTLEEKQLGMETKKAEEVKQIITTKGKQLKDLRVEFEAVFDEKNKIIETIRDALKSSRDEVVVMQQSARDSAEEKRKLELLISNLELEKLQLGEETLSSPVDAVQVAEEDSVQGSADDTVSKSDENERLLAENIAVMEKTTEELTSLERDNSEMQAVLNDVVKAIADVSDLHHISNSLDNIPKKITQLVSNLASTKKYCDELSMKMHTVMEEKPVEDFSAQFDDANIREEVRGLEEQVKSLQEELSAALKHKENAQGIVREEYDDILSNLQTDLNSSMLKNRSIQEENFSLRSQLDVFTNVNKKNKESMSLPVTPLSSPAPGEKTPPQKEGFVAKTEFNKLKVLCRKYKNDLITQKGLEEAKEKELAELQSNNESLLQEKMELTEENKNLRGQINYMMDEKDGMVESFKSQSETDLSEMTETLNKLNADVRSKDELIEQLQSELSDLKISTEQLAATDSSSDIEQLSTLDHTELIRRVDVMQKQVGALQTEKRNCLAQLRSHREEITDFVQQRDQMVRMWQSKLEQKEKTEDSLKKEIEELRNRIEGGEGASGMKLRI